MVKLKKRLGVLLIEVGLITQDQLEKALHIQKKMGKRLGRVLIELEYITEESLIEVLEFQLGVPHVDLERLTIDPAIAGVISEAIAKRHQVIPIRREGTKLVLAMADPTNIFAIDDIHLATGLQIEIVISSESEIDRAINKSYGVQKTVQKAMNQLSIDESFAILEDAFVTESDAPIISIVNSLFQQAAKDGASDIHIEPQEKELRVRFRVDGILREMMVFPKRIHGAITSRIKIMSEMDISERRVPQEGRIKLRFTGRDIDVRVSTLPTIYGEKVVGRLLDQCNMVLNIESLGFSERNLKQFGNISQKSYGMTLVTGPTGSGKTTTLYATLSKYNTSEKNIVTVEDPVEYRLSGINQVNINPKAGLDFSDVLRSILRQDPNIIMVGEIRDGETAEIAIRAALTGHLVLSTLHTNDAASTVTRLIDMGVEPYLIASSVLGVLSQRLVRKICPNCKVGYRLEAKSSEDVFIKQSGYQVDTLYRGQGCPVCNQTGYKGRVAIHEVLVVSPAIRELVVTRSSSGKITEQARREGMHTLQQDGIEKAIDGITTIQEVMRVALS
jgi:type IV pilus assembly protein PilB